MGLDAKTKPTLSSDALHNRNCYAYLLQLKPLINDPVKQLLPQFARLMELPDAYQENYPYGDLYSLCIAELELMIEEMLPDKIGILDDLILGIYHNDNHILEQSADWINEIGDKTRPQAPHTGKAIEHKLKSPQNTVNQRSPSDAGSKYSLLRSLFSTEFKPQLDTNLPSIKNYSYKNQSEAIEYRFSTQGQRHKGNVRVSPLFKRWLLVNAQRSPDQVVCHIYFNNLSADQGDLDIQRSKERKLTSALHELEQDPKLKTIVITLPANEGLMNSSDYEINDDQLSYSAVFNELLTVARGELHKSGISDFIISKTARTFLFGTLKNEKSILTNLLIKSFEAQGVVKNQNLTTAQKQAVWVHFIKYELTNYIIDKARPKSYNFSCKDAIDRGALSSTYYNLMKSFESEKPMQRDECERSLDAAAANVKGRGMNFHRKIIWNALNGYVNANYEQLMANKEKSWLIYWRDMSCPHSRVEELIKIRMKNSISEFAALPATQFQELGVQLLATVEKLNSKNVSGKRLLLEAVSRTSELISYPSHKSAEKYKQLAEELKIKHPALLIIGGIMEAILGTVLYIPSLGYSQKLIDRGISTMNTGFFAHYRTELIEQLNEFASSESIPLVVN